MTDIITEAKRKIYSGEDLNKTESLQLYQQPLDELCETANEIRLHYCGNAFDLCTIINGKSGRCSEDCKFCAQSAFYSTAIETYPLLSAERILRQAKYDAAHGAMRYSIVTSGKSLNDNEVSHICQSVQAIREATSLQICVSPGLLQQKQLQQLKDAGVTRIHHNLETSRRNFPHICTTHNYDDKLATIHAAQSVGLPVCSGGIFGLGETPEDRIDLALELRELGIESVPINLLNPIPGTPYAALAHLTPAELRRIVAVFRFLLPRAFIRLAGGRGLLDDKGRSYFLSGANAAITGDMLTTSGISIENDLQMLQELGYAVVLKNT